MKRTVIPKFKSEAEEAAWWDAHRSEVEAEIRRRMQRKPLTLDALLKKDEPSQPITLRIAKEDLETARRLAAERGVGYQTYLKMLLRGALAKQSTKRVERANGKRVARRGA
jgi:predicted DNA binding CopG/RHH family protein